MLLAKELRGWRGTYVGKMVAEYRLRILWPEPTCQPVMFKATARYSMCMKSCYLKYFRFKLDQGSICSLIILYNRRCLGEVDFWLAAAAQDGWAVTKLLSSSHKRNPDTRPLLFILLSPFFTIHIFLIFTILFVLQYFRSFFHMSFYTIF